LSVLTGLDKSFKDNILTRNGDVKPPYSEKYNFEVSPYLNTEYLCILVDEKLLGNSPLRLKKVRQAINFAIDRGKMMRYLHNDIGDPGIYGFVPPSLIENNKKYYDYDPEKARKLLQEAGFKSNEKITGLKLATTEIYLDMAIFIQKQLESVGIFIEIDNAPPGTLSEWKAQSKTQFFRGSWVADYADAENYLSVFYSKNWSPDGPNYFHYKNAEFDKLYEQVLLLTDEKQKQISYAKMQDILMEDAPVIVLFYDEVIRLKQKNVKGLAPNAINLINLKGVRLE
jgi:peptide/nickel transport system substrate-binding protein